MRLIKIQLKRSVPFWALSGLMLNINNPTSEPIDVDELAEWQIEVIEKAITQDEITVKDMEGKSVRIIKDTKELNGYTVSTEDVKEEVLPEVQSVTVSMDDEDDEPEVHEEQNPMEEALIILNNNGNTVKKTIAAVDITQSNSKNLLNACLSVEIGDKNRAGVIDAIQERLGECA